MSETANSEALSPGQDVAGCKLQEKLVTGEKISLWRARKNDGSAVTIHALHGSERKRERENFLGGTRRLQAATRVRPLKGVVDIVAVVPNIPLYVGRGGVAGTMVDTEVFGWDVTENVGFWRRICEATEALHKAGLVHGCMRPANVLLDDDLQPRLADVGMIVIDDSYDGPSDMKHDYSAYAAREVRLGAKATVQSDIFSLGRLLYYALTREVPDEADEDVPALVALADLPPGLIRIIRRATLRDAYGRYQDIAELLADVDKFRDGDVGVAHPHGPDSRGSIPPDALSRPSQPPGSLRALTDSGSHRRVDSEASPTPPASRRSVAPAAAEKEEKVAAPVFRASFIDEPAREDVLSDRQAISGAVVGLLLAIIAGLVAYFTGEPSKGVTVGFVLATIGISLLVPPIGSPLLSRSLVALILAVGVWWLSPAQLVAQLGRRAALASGTPAERGIRLGQLRDRGIRDFTQLDLRGVDASNQDLSGLRFDASRLDGALLVDCILRGASLAQTELRGADVSGADLSGTDVTRALGWHETRCSETTVMPEGWVCRDATPVPDDQLAAPVPGLEQ